jgi:hypothetical protein
VPRLGGLRHESHDDDAAEEGSLNQQLVAEAIGDAAPERCAERGNAGCDAESGTGPERDLSRISDAELLDIS